MAKAKTGRPVIYGLADPRTGEVRYIGKANDAQRRLGSHLRDARRRDTPVYCWLRKLVSEGLVPNVVVLEFCSGDWREAERRLIAQARARGERILNLADGGDEPFCSHETRVANGRRNAAAIHSDPERKRIWALKRTLNQNIRLGYCMNKTRAKLREAARLNPRLFGCWANLQDREENPDGSSVALFGRTG